MGCSVGEACGGCAQSGRARREVYGKLRENGVLLEGSLLKPSMTVPGVECPDKSGRRNALTARPSSPEAQPQLFQALVKVFQTCPHRPYPACMDCVTVQGHFGESSGHAGVY